MRYTSRLPSLKCYMQYFKLRQNYYKTDNLNYSEKRATAAKLHFTSITTIPN